MKKQKEKKESNIIRSTEYEKRPGSANAAGVFYEHYMSLLLFTRAMTTAWKFRMAQNMRNAYDFDDIVINFPDVGKTFFIQLKHKINPQTITISHLQNLSGDFSLFKYFKSYCLLKEHYSKNLSHFGNFEDFMFVIYTNAHLNDSVKVCVTPLEKKWVDFLSTGGKVLGFNTDNFEKIRKMLEKREVYALLLQKAIESVSLLSAEEGQSLVKFIQTFSNNNIHTLPPKEELQKELKKFKTAFEVTEGNKVIEVMNMTNSSFECFMKQLVFFSKQSSERGAKGKISEELEKIYMDKITDMSHIDLMRNEFQKVAEGSHTSKTHYITHESNIWPDTVIKPWILRLSKEILEQLQPLLKLSFSNKEYRRICPPNTKVQMTVAGKGGAKLSLLKIHQSLQSELHIIITWKKFLEYYKQVLTLWQNWCNILVIEIQTNVNINDVMQQMGKMSEKQRLILITEHTISGDLKSVTSVYDMHNIWKSLSRDSKEEIFNVKMVVQGTETTFGEAVGKKTFKWEQLMSSAFLLYLMEVESPICIGNDLKLPGIYIKRSLQQFVNLNETVIKISTAKFAISCKTENLRKEFQQKFPDGIMLDKCSMINTKEEFNYLANRFEDHNVHLLMYDGNALVWKQSVGDMSDLIRHVDVHSQKPKLYEPEHVLKKPRMLLIAESGMGKSTFLSQMAVEMKQLKGSALWIAKINLEDHRHMFDNTRVPKELDLIHAAEPYSNKFDKVFVEMMLKAGRVAVFLDSFDEVSHSDVVLDVLRNFLECPDIILWVASRPVPGGKLETLFQMLPYSLPYFTFIHQQKYLLQKWTHPDLNIVRVKKFIECILKSVCMHPSGIPLSLLIISEIFQEELKQYVCNYSPFASPEKVDNAFLHEKCVRKKLEIYCKRNGVSMNMVPIIEPVYIENHMLLSLAEVIDINQLEIATYINTKVSSLNLERIQHMGIIDISSSGRIAFLHRSFAEYFAALWFKMYYLCSSNYLRDQIFKCEFQPIRNYLDNLLTKGLTLHSEIIKGKKNIHLPKSKVAINFEDVAGRTPLHLLVLIYKDEMSLGNTVSCISSLSLAEKLLSSGANPNTTDRMLGWSCSQYALEAEAWALLELMLKHGADCHFLTSITNKLKQSSRSKHVLLNTVAECGFTNLLHLVLKHIDVNEYVNNFKGTLKTMLHIAIEADNLEIVKQLVKEGADVNLRMMVRDYFENSAALHIAAQKGNHNMVQYLLEHHALLNMTGAFGRLPIEEAAVFSKWKMVRYLSDQGAVLKPNCYSPLICAVKRGKLSIVKHLVKNHEIDLDHKKELMDLAIVLGKLDIIKFFVSQGLTIDEFHSSLIEAAKLGRLGIVKYLIQNGAPVNGTNSQKHTAYYAAVVSGKRKTANFLRKAGGSFTSRKSQIKAFHEAARSGNKKALNIFLENIQVDERNQEGWTALHVASWVGNTDVVAFLLRKGAKVNAMTEKPRLIKPCFNEHAPHLDNSTALHLAAARGKWETLELLVNKGADINRYNKEGETALHVAACHGHYFLLDYLCTVYDINNTRTRKADLVLHSAIRHTNLEVVKCLTDECNAELNAKGRNGSTPLCLAVEYNSIALVLHLLSRGADIDGMDNAGNTPLILAAQDRKLHIMHLLLRKGAAANTQNKKGSTALHIAAGRLDFSAVSMLTVRGGINIHVRDRKGRTALKIAQQRCTRKPSCTALVHKFQKPYSYSVPSQIENCICVPKYAASTARYIVIHLGGIVG